MVDILYVILVVTFFGTCLGLLKLCQMLMEE